MQDICADSSDDAYRNTIQPVGKTVEESAWKPNNTHTHTHHMCLWTVPCSTGCISSTPASTCSLAHCRYYYELIYYVSFTTFYFCFTIFVCGFFFHQTFLWKLQSIVTFVCSSFNWFFDGNSISLDTLTFQYIYNYCNCYFVEVNEWGKKTSKQFFRG